MSIPYAEVIGDPIIQSKSPVIHGLWLRKLGLTGDYRHAHVRAQDLADYIAQRRKDPDWRGCNVTMPHKQAIMPLLDRLDPLAGQVGAVNTVVPVDGQLVGFNTDVDGVAEPLRKLAIADGAHAYVIGAGGAARAGVVGVAKAGRFVVDVFNRTPEKADPLAVMAGAPNGGLCKAAIILSSTRPAWAWADKIRCRSIWRPSPPTPSCSTWSTPR